MGIYDQGSPSIAGFEGIAHFKQDRHYWPICRQGNFVYWAFDGPIQKTTEDVQQLYRNVLAYLKSEPSKALSGALAKRNYVRPGQISGRLTEQTDFSHQHHFQVLQPGKILADLSWSPVDHAMAAILNGPGKVGYYERGDGESPLHIVFEVDADLQAIGTDWKLSVTTFDASAPFIDYQLEPSFPDSPD
jgi:hypothetical protein